MATLMVLAAGRRGYVVEQLLAAARPDDRLVVADASGHAPALSVPGALPLVEPADPDAASEWLVRTCRERRVDAVISLHDYHSLRIARLADRLAAVGTRFIGPTPASALVCLDKVLLSDHLMGVAPQQAVPTVTLPEFPAVKDGWGAAGWVVKDRCGSGSSGLRFHPERLSLLDAAEQPGAADLIVQPRYEGQEWNVDLFVNLHGEVVGHCAKRKLRMRGGETDAAVVVPRPPRELLEGCIAALGGLDIVGNVDMDVIETPDGFRLIDVNPRLGGGYAFSAQAGYGAAAGLWATARGGESRECFGELRSLVAAKAISVVEIADAGACELAWA